MKTNVKEKSASRKTLTPAGAITYKISEYENLRRLVLACMLWEDNFYVDGEEIASQIKGHVAKCEPEQVAALAIEARTKFKLRHIPLLLVREMARLDSHKSFVATTLYEIIERADELAEFLAIYWKEKRQPLSSQVKKGLAKAFTKFSEYDLAKYNRDSKVKLRDVLFLSHAKPLNKAQEKLWKKLIDGKLETPDTWETQLSAGKDKKATFERLMQENKLGALALIRNLRNMKEAKVSNSVISEALEKIKTDRVLPFRFMTAAKYAPEFEDKLEKAMFKCLSQKEKLTGKTVVVVDVSGSMRACLSAKSEMTREGSASALAVLIRELSEDILVFATAGDDWTHKHATALVPSRHGKALVEAINQAESKLGGGGIFLTQVMNYIKKEVPDADRIIVITDEADCDRGSERAPDKADAYGKFNYILNVGSYQNGIAYNKKWLHVTGFSESVLDFIAEFEKANRNKNE